MPAINPARLKKQAADLAARCNDPLTFVRHLHKLLDQYSDHTHRKGQAGEPSPLLATYNAPPQVMRTVWLELSMQIKRDPGITLSLCDALWTEPNYDFHLLASRLLGSYSVNPPDPVVGRVQEWVCQTSEEGILDEILQFALINLKRDAPEMLVELVSKWLESRNLCLQQAGLRVLIILVDQPGSEHLPTVLHMMTPYVRSAPARLRPDVLAVLTALAHCSPSETAYLLRQNLSAPDNPDTAWIIRQVIDEFPLETRLSLRQDLKRSNV